jgi:hypothetical protein
VIVVAACTFTDKRANNMAKHIKNDMAVRTLTVFDTCIFLPPFKCFILLLMVNKVLEAQ